MDNDLDTRRCVCVSESQICQVITIKFGVGRPEIIVQLNTSSKSIHQSLPLPLHEPVTGYSSSAGGFVQTVLRTFVLTPLADR